jgi:hypothetical protein
MSAVGDKIFQAAMFKKQQQFQNRYLAAQYGWKLGLNDAKGGGGGATPTSVTGGASAPGPDPMAGPTDAVGPLRVPGTGKMRPGGARMPRLSMGGMPSMGAAPSPALTGDASFLRRRDEEEDLA